MLPFDKAPNLSPNASGLETARATGMNMSQTVEALPDENVGLRHWEKWRNDNREAFTAYNERIRSEGLPLARYRNFGQGLGDGTVAGIG